MEEFDEEIELGAEGQGIYDAFIEFIDELKNNNRPNGDELEQWIDDKNLLEKDMSRMWQAAIDVNITEEQRAENKKQYYAMSSVCEYLLKEVKDLLEEKQHQLVQNSMAGPSTAQPVAGASAAGAAADPVAQREAEARRLMPPPPSRSRKR